MGQYRLLITSIAFLLPLCAIAVEPTDAPDQAMTSSDAMPEHQHHHEPVAGEKMESKPPSEEKEQPMHHGMDRGEHSMHKDRDMGEHSMHQDMKEDHHHHYVPFVESKPPSEDKEQPMHRGMDRGEHHMGMGDMDMGEHSMDMDMDMGMEGRHMHHMHNMRMDAGGMVMNENKDNLPADCPELASDVEITVRAGVKYAQEFPGTVFGYDKHEWHVKPCSRVTVTFINEDDVRHQWMIHGLPAYIYPRGMFHIGVSGSGRRTGTFIVPSTETTYFIHCDISQHAAKGMKAQLVVGDSKVNLPSIPGITAPVYPDSYAKDVGWRTISSSVGAGIIGLALAIVGLGRVSKRKIEAKETHQGQAAISAPEAKQQKGRLFGRK